MKYRSRLLGLAFASADLLVELDHAHRIEFALGSAPGPACPPIDSWRGQPFANLLGKASQSAFTRITRDLGDGARSEPLEVLLTCGPEQVRRARISVFRLPELSPALSCALVYQGGPFSLALPHSPSLLNGAGLLERARHILTGELSDPLSFAFIDVPGLASVDGEQGQRATARVAAAIQAASVNGASAARLTPERFALLKDRSYLDNLLVDLRDAGAAEGVELSPHAAQSDLLGGTDALSTLRALRFTIEGCIRDGGLADPGRTFSETLKKTLSEASTFRAMVKARKFALHYQPIVDLGSGAVHHFEALARFSDESPARAIHMAEEMGLIADFDLAVLTKAIQMTRQPGHGLVKVAVNVSGMSLASDTFVETLLRLTAAQPHERRRLMIEVTETAALADLEAADRRLSVLRDAGVTVCIDDFGAGSASFDYLRGLSVDSVKIDGDFVRDLEGNPRSRTLITHLVELCDSLKLTTIGEMIETETVADTLRSIGVDYGQGWFFGRPTPEPVKILPPRSTVASRRTGVVSEWL